MRSFSIILVLMVLIGASVARCDSSPGDSALADWVEYRNADLGFELKCPPGAIITSTDSLTLKIELPFEPGTKLKTKNMTVKIREASSPTDCFGQIMWKDTIKINGIEFNYIPGFKWDHAMGGLDFFASDYYTFRDNKCIMLFFRMGKRDTTGFTDDPVPPDPPDKDIDTVIFDQMLATFRFVE